MTLQTRFAHVSPRTVRFWAMLDSGVLSLALPFTAVLFLDAIYWLNGLFGGAATAPEFGALQMFFVNLSGVLVGVWVAARLLMPIGLLAFIDVIGRSAVALLIVWFVLAQDAPPVLWLFVFTEGIGALAQLRACLTAPRD